MHHCLALYILILSTCSYRKSPKRSYLGRLHHSSTPRRNNEEASSSLFHDLKEREDRGVGEGTLLRLKHPRSGHEADASSSPTEMTDGAEDDSEIDCESVGSEFYR